MRLSYDIARCMTAADGTCPLRRSCARWIVPGREGYQSFTAFEGGKDCDGFIAVKEQKDGV